MSDRWKLAIYHPGSNTPDSTYTDTSPGGIVDGFEWTLAATGASKQLRFRAVPSMTDLPPRALVELDVGGDRQFRGVLVQTWSPQDTNVREYVAVGLELLVQQDVAESLDITEADPANWFYNLADALAYAGTWFEVGDTEQDGSTLAMENYQGLPASQVFDDLTRACQHTRAWWLTLDGYIVFKDPTGSTLTISSDDPGLEWRAEDSTETYDRVELYLLGRPQPPDVRWDYGEPGPAGRRPVIYSYRTSADRYKSTRVLTLPTQLDFLARGSGTAYASSSSWQNLSNVSDGDDGTYASYTSSSQSSSQTVWVTHTYNADEPVMYWGRVLFDSAGTRATMYIVHEIVTDSDLIGSSLVLDLGDVGKKRSAWIAHPWPPQADNALTRRTKIGITFYDVPANTTLEVYSVEPYYYSPAKLARYAKRFVQLPSQYPGAYVQQQLQNTGVWEVTVTDLAGEDRTFRVSEIQNRYTIASGAWSRIVFGGDTLGEAARMVQIRDQRVHDSALLSAASERRQA